MLAHPILDCDFTFGERMDLHNAAAGRYRASVYPFVDGCLADPAAFCEIALRHAFGHKILVQFH